MSVNEFVRVCNYLSVNFSRCMCVNTCVLVCVCVHVCPGVNVSVYIGGAGKALEGTGAHMAVSWANPPRWERHTDVL